MSPRILYLLFGESWLSDTKTIRVLTIFSYPGKSLAQPNNYVWHRFYLVIWGYNYVNYSKKNFKQVKVSFEYGTSFDFE